jgi:Zn-dependent protease
MRGWSFPLGRWGGVEIRIHSFFVMLLGFCILFSSADKTTLGAGTALWFLLLLAVGVREVTRLIVAAWLGLNLRNILLLPTGGLYAYADPDSQEKAATGSALWTLALAGPVGNLVFAAISLSLMLGATSQIDLISQPWVGPTHLLRSFLWLNILLGGLHLIPAYPLDAGRILRSFFAHKQGTIAATRSAAGLGQLLAFSALIGGVLIQNPWLVMAGFFILIGAQLEDQGLLFQSVVDTVKMKDVMLTSFSTLSPSDTLIDALERSIHALQEDFPVVRGQSLIGIVSRQRIMDALRTEGNGYIQSIISRAFQVATPEDSLGATIRRMQAGHGLGVVAVAEGERIVGIVSLQNLMQSMGVLSEHRRQMQQEAQE